MSGSPIKPQRGWPIVVLALVIVAGLLYILQKQKQKNAAISNISIAAKKVANEAAKTEIIEKNDSDEDEDDEDDSAPERVVVCGPKDKSQNVRLTNERFLTLLRENSVWQPEVGAQACYHQGQSAIALVFKTEKRIAYEVNPRGKVIVEAIEEMTLAQAKEDKKFLLTEQDEKMLLRGIRRRARHTGEKAKNIKIKFLKLKPESWFEKKQTYGAPLIHPMAQTLDKADFQAAKSKGDTVYDVRPAEFYKVKSIEGAANAPASKFDAKQFIVLSPSQLEAMSFSIDPTTLPKKKRKTPLIIFSSCGGDALSYNSITYLRKLGYRKIQWYRGGLENWLNGAGCGTPDNVPGLGILTADEVQKKLAAKAILLYVSGGVDLRKYEIKGSKKIEYRQKYLSDFMAAFRKTSFTMEEFKKSGDEVDIESMNLPKDAQIIIYGRYDYDWRSLKTAQLMRLKGYKFVYWYRDGLDDWLNHALFRPQDFPTQPDFVRE